MKPEATESKPQHQLHPGPISGANSPARAFYTNTTQAPSLEPTAPPEPTRAQDGATRAMRPSTGH